MLTTAGSEIGQLAVPLLFRLPRELLDLLAEHFSRSEAAPLLAVCSSFHELFAPRVWRNLDGSDKSVRVVVQVLQTSIRDYAPLLRRLTIGNLAAIPDGFDKLLRNVTHFTTPYFVLQQAIATYRQPFHRLLQLKVSVFPEDLDYMCATASKNSVVRWLNGEFGDESAHAAVCWTLQSNRHVEDFAEVFALVSAHRARHQVSLINIDQFDMSDDRVRALIPHIDFWNADISGDICSSKRLNALLSAVPSTASDFCFPAIKQLEIGVCCAALQQARPDLQFAAMFPAVRELVLYGATADCVESGIHHIRHLFTQPWLSVQTLRVHGVFTQDSIDVYLSALPNLTELDVDNSENDFVAGSVSIDLRVASVKTPQLAKLKLGNASLTLSAAATSGPTAHLFGSLAEVELTKVNISPSVLHSVASAPVLQKLTLIETCFGADGETTDDYIGALAGVKNTSMRTFQLYSDQYTEHADQCTLVTAMLKCFVRLVVLCAYGYDKEQLEVIRAALPGAEFKWNP